MSTSSQFESFQPTVSDNSQKGNLSNSIPELYSGLPQLSAKGGEAAQSALNGNSIDFGHDNIYVDTFNPGGVPGGEVPPKTNIQSGGEVPTGVQPLPGTFVGPNDSVSPSGDSTPAIAATSPLGDINPNTIMSAQANAENTMQAAANAGQTGSDSAGSSSIQQELATILTDLTQLVQELEGGGNGSGSGADGGGTGGINPGGFAGDGGSSSGSASGAGGTGAGDGSGSSSGTGEGSSSGGSGGSDSAAMQIFNTLSNNPNFTMGNPFSSDSESGGDLSTLQQLQQASGLSDSDFVNTFDGALLSSGINNDASTAGLNAALDGNGQPGGMGDPLNLGFASLSNALQTVQSEDPGATGTQLVNAVVNELTTEDNQSWQQMWGTESAGQAAALLNSSDIGNGINANPSMGATPASEQAAQEHMQQMWAALAAADGDNNQSDPYLYTPPTAAQ